MAHHKSAKKRIKTNEKRRLRNKTRQSEIKTWMKKFYAEENIEKKSEHLKKIQSLVDKAVKVKLYKKNKGSRIKAKLMKALKESN